MHHILKTLAITGPLALALEAFSSNAEARAIGGFGV
jgi:hypothetical protein